MANIQKKHRGPRMGDLRDILLASGIGEYNAPMAIQFMNFLPQTCDPYAMGTILLTQGLQTQLNNHGAKLAVDGGLGMTTVAALKKFAGPNWYDKSWAQLYGDVMSGRRYQGQVRENRQPEDVLAGFEYAHPELGDTVETIVKSPIAWAAAGALIWWKFLRKPRGRRS